jgi:hypothetical protein
MVNEDAEAVLAAAYPRFAAIDAVSEHVPASTKAIAPEDELTVQIEVVDEE